MLDEGVQPVMCSGRSIRHSARVSRDDDLELLHATYPASTGHRETSVDQWFIHARRIGAALPTTRAAWYN